MKRSGGFHGRVNGLYGHMYLPQVGDAISGDPPEVWDGEFSELDGHPPNQYIECGANLGRATLGGVVCCNVADTSSSS